MKTEIEASSEMFSSLKKKKILSVYFIPALISCSSLHDNLVMQTMVWPCLV